MMKIKWKHWYVDVAPRVLISFITLVASPLVIDVTHRILSK